MPQDMPLDVPPPRDSRFGSPLVLSRVHWVRPALGLSSPVSGLYPMSPARLSTSGSTQGWPTEAPRGPEGLQETSREATAV